MGHASTSLVVVTLMVHLGTMLSDRGFSIQTIGWVVATQTGVTALFNIVGGYVGDKIPIRIALFIFSVIQTAGLVILLIAYTPSMVYIFAIVYGIGFGGRTPLTTSIRGAYFGRKAFASITGISMIPMNILHLAAPLFAGIMFDLTNSYDIPFGIIAIVSLIGGFLFLLLGSPANMKITHSAD
jgi:MFS family permease